MSENDDEADDALVFFLFFLVGGYLYWPNWDSLDKIFIANFQFMINTFFTLEILLWT